MPVSPLGRRPSDEIIALQPRISRLGQQSPPPTPEGLVGFDFGPTLSNAARIAPGPFSPGLDYIDGDAPTPGLSRRINQHAVDRALAARASALRDPKHAALIFEVREALEREKQAGGAKNFRDAMMHVFNMPVDERNKREQEKLLREQGSKTSLKPAFYLFLAQLGRVGYGMGPTLLEHEANPYQPNAPNTVPEGDNGPPRPLQGAREVSPGHLALGVAISSLGIVLGVTAAVLCLNQAKKNNRSIAWRNFGLHLSAIALLSGHRFLTEWLAYNRSPSKAMLGAIPGVLGTTIFGYTVPNSITVAETRLGLMPLGSLKFRAELARWLFAIGTGVYAVWGMLLGAQQVPAYGRDGVLIVATLFATTGISFANTIAQQYESVVARGLDKEQRAQHIAQAQQSPPRERDAPRRPAALQLPLPRPVRPALPPRDFGISGSQVPMLARHDSDTSAQASGVLRRSSVEHLTGALYRRRSEPDVYASMPQTPLTPVTNARTDRINAVGAPPGERP